MNQKHGWGSTLLISLFVPVVGLLLPFLHIYLINAAGLTLPLRVHLPELVLACGASAAVLFGLQVLLPARARRGAAALMLAWGTALWAQSTLFIGDFGVLLGGDLDWAGQRHLAYLEFLAAATLIVVLARWRDTLLRRAGTVMLLVTLSAGVNLLPPLLAREGRAPASSDYTFTRAGVFDLSARRNVLVFILDSYQSDVFAEILVEQPRWRKVLEGFTYFPDATSSFPRTYASVPSILTGQAFDNTRPFGQYLRQAYLGASAPRILKRNGFDCRFFSFSWQPFYAHPEVADNLAGADGRAGAGWMRQREATQLKNLLLFRLAPYPAKPWVFNDNLFRLKAPAGAAGDEGNPYPLTDEQKVYSAGNNQEDLEFLDLVQAHLKTGGERPAFRVYHLAGPHAPFVLDPQLNLVDQTGYGRRPFRDQSEASLRLLELVFARLRELDIYDQSLILVISDHGGGSYHQVGIRPEGASAWGHDSLPAEVADPALQEIIRGGIPLVLAKAPHRQGPLAVSLAPVELTDIPGTIFRTLDLDAPGNPPSIFTVDPGAPRRRLHRFYRFTDWAQDYIVPMTEYAVQGFSWDPRSWAPSGRNLNLAAARSAAGSLVVLGPEGNLDEFAGRGWSKPGDQGRRMGPDGASVTLPAPDRPGAAALEMTVRLDRPADPPVPLALRVGGQEVAVWTLDVVPDRNLRCLVPAHLLDGSSEVAIGLQAGPDPAAGPEVITLRLAPGEAFPPYETGQEVDFRSGGNAGPYRQAGWHEPEPWGAWVHGYAGSVALQLDPVPEQGLVLEARLQAALFRGSDPVAVEVVAGGRPIAQLEIASGGIETYSWPIPGEALPPSGQLILTFKVANPRTASSFGVNQDTRPLGLGVAGIRLLD